MEKSRCCPIIDGSRSKRLVGLAKLAEIGVILVALFVLQEVRSNVIPWGCSIADKQRCFRENEPDAQFLLGSCDDARASCYDGGVYPVTSNATDNGYPASSQRVFGFCQCLVYSQNKSGVPIPGHCEFSNIFSILIFVLGAAVILVSELLLPRKATAVLVFMGCELYFVVCPQMRFRVFSQNRLFKVSLMIVLSLGWGGLCQGIIYNQITSIFTALIIGQCLFFLIAFAIMVCLLLLLAHSDSN
jgi:hypothetical protein